MNANTIQAWCIWLGIFNYYFMIYGGSRIPLLRDWERRAPFGFWFAYFAGWYTL